MLLISAGSGLNRVQVVLYGFSVRLLCFVQAETLCRYGCMYFFAALVLVCVFRELCPSFFCSTWSCRMLIVVMMGKWSDDSAC